MAFGAFESYEPDPTIPGAYRFQTKTGQDLLFTGPEAESLKQRIDASNAASPQPIALATPENPQVAPATPEAFQNPYRSVADVSAPNPSVQTAGDTVPQPPPQAAPQQGPRVVSQEIKGGKLYTNYIDKSTGQLHTMIKTPGSAGVSREQLQKQDAQAVAQRTHGSKSVEGGFAPNQEFVDKATTANTNQQLANVVGADVIQSQAEQERHLANVRAEEQAKTVDQERQRQNEISARVQKDQDTLDQARQEFKSAKVDPQRMFHGDGGAAVAIGSAIGAALGAAGASLGHSDNYALNWINKSIDRDIAAQQQEIATKGEDANNALQQFRASTGSLEQAKSALKVAQLEYAQSQNAAISAKAKGDLAQANAASTNAGLQDAINKELEKYRIDSLGKHTAQVAEQFAHPKAATAGSTVDLVASPGEQKQTIELEKGKAEVGLVGAQAAKAGAEATGAGKGGVPRGLQNRVVSADVALQKIDAIANRMQVPREKDGNINAEGYGYGQYSKASGALANPKKYIQFSQDQAADSNALIADVANAFGNTSDAHMKELHEQWESASPGGKAALLRSWRDSINEVRNKSYTITGPKEEEQQAPTMENSGAEKDVVE